MTHATFIAEIEDWLIGKALGDPDIRTLFEALCERLHAVGIPLERASLSWPTLHPLFQSEQVFWRMGQDIEFQQYLHGLGSTEKWLRSPLYHVVSRQLPNLRRRLAGDGAMRDFDVLDDLHAQGFTDYLVTGTRFGIAEVTEYRHGRTGLVASWATRRGSGFTDDDLDALERIQRVFAIACRGVVQKRVMTNIANAYLGSTAGWQVLTGDIRRGDGNRLPAVIWYSDLRGSTRLSDTMDPDSYLSLLNVYFECTAQPIIDQGGEILNFIGDGVLGIFPIETACPRDAAAKAEAAVLAARTLRAEKIRQGTPGDAPLEFGVGLGIGDVMFGNIGVASRLAFSGIGQSVNAVQRVESATKKLGLPVLALAEFAEAAPGDWRSAGEIEIRDFDRRVGVYTLATEVSSGQDTSASVPGG